MLRLSSGDCTACEDPHHHSMGTTHVAPTYHRGQHRRFCCMPSGLTLREMTSQWLVANALRQGAHLIWMSGYVICSAPLRSTPLGDNMQCTSAVGRRIEQLHEVVVASTL